VFFAAIILAAVVAHPKPSPPPRFVMAEATVRACASLFGNEDKPPEATVVIGTCSATARVVAALYNDKSPWLTPARRYHLHYVVAVSEVMVADAYASQKNKELTSVALAIAVSECEYVIHSDAPAEQKQMCGKVENAVDQVRAEAGIGDPQSA
jgi:hypothetical protein